MPSIGRIIKTGVCVLACAASGSIVATSEAASTGEPAKECPAALTAKDGVATPVYRFFGDHNNYFLARGGSFEPTAPVSVEDRWSLSSRARVMLGGDTTPMIGTRGSALTLTGGQWAVTAPICIDVTRPHFRFSARADRSPAWGTTPHDGGYPGAQIAKRMWAIAGQYPGLFASEKSVTPLAAPASVSRVGTGPARLAGALTGELHVSVVALNPKNATRTISETAIGLHALDFQTWTISPFAKISPKLYTDKGWALASLMFYVPRGSWRIDSVYVDPYRKR